MDRMHSTKKVYISKTFLDQKRSQYLLVNSTIIHPTITITTLLSPLQLKQIIKMYKKEISLTPNRSPSTGKSSSSGSRHTEWIVKNRPLLSLPYFLSDTSLGRVVNIMREAFLMPSRARRHEYTGSGSDRSSSRTRLAPDVERAVRRSEGEWEWETRQLIIIFKSISAAVMTLTRLFRSYICSSPFSFVPP